MSHSIHSIRSTMYMLICARCIIFLRGGGGGGGGGGGAGGGGSFGLMPVKDVNIHVLVASQVLVYQYCSPIFCRQDDTDFLWSVKLNSYFFIFSEAKFA